VKPLLLASALLAVLALCAPALAAAPKTTLPDVEDEVMCVVCGTSLEVSNSPVADQERAFIRRRIAEGQTKAQIKAGLVREYGPDVLAEPSGSSFDVASWLVPAVLVLAALLGVGGLALRWRRRPAGAAGGAGGAGSIAAAGPPLSAADLRRLDDDLRDFDR
jgi:cytochrome c-type biogenesis protein CcmH/NrfF